MRQFEITAYNGTKGIVHAVRIAHAIILFCESTGLHEMDVKSIKCLN